MLNLSFVGTSALEILCHAPLSDRLIAGMKLLGFRQLPNLNPLSANNGLSRSEKAQLTACYRRWSHAATQTSSPVSQALYRAEADKLAREHPGLQQQNTVLAAGGE